MSETYKIDGFVNEFVSLLPRFSDNYFQTSDTGVDVLQLACLGIVGGFTFILVLDNIFMRHVVPASVRYFCLHICFNAWIVGKCLKDAIFALQYPMDAVTLPYVHSGKKHKQS